MKRQNTFNQLLNCAAALPNLRGAINTFFYIRISGLCWLEDALDVSPRSPSCQIQLPRSGGRPDGAKTQRSPVLKLFVHLTPHFSWIVRVYYVPRVKRTADAFGQPDILRWKSQCVPHGQTIAAFPREFFTFDAGRWACLQGLPMRLHGSPLDCMWASVGVMWAWCGCVCAPMSRKIAAGIIQTLHVHFHTPNTACSPFGILYLRYVGNS